MYHLGLYHLHLRLREPIGKDLREWRSRCRIYIYINDDFDHLEMEFYFSKTDRYREDRVVPRNMKQIRRINESNTLVLKTWRNT